MSWTLRRFQVIITWTVVVIWVVLYFLNLAADLANGEPMPAPESAIRTLIIPPVLWVCAARLALHHWWSATGSKMSEMDPPQRLLAAATAALPERRRDWGMAMIAELADIPRRTDRWRFALSSVRAMLWLPPAGGWPVLALVTGIASAGVVAAGSLASATTPQLDVFAAAFAGLLGVFAVVTVARSARIRTPAPIPALLVTVTVAAAIALTVVFLRRDASAAHYLPPGSAIILAVVLAVCLRVALLAPARNGRDRGAIRLGTGAALLYVGGFLLLTRAAYTLPEQVRQTVAVLAAMWLLLAPATVFFFVSLAASSIGQSFRSGVRAGVWAGAVGIPLAYSIWLYESLHMYTINGGLLLFGDGAPEAENLQAALTFCLLTVVVFGAPFAVFGAAVGARQHRRIQPAVSAPGQ